MKSKSIYIESMWSKLIMISCCDHEEAKIKNFKANKTPWASKKVVNADSPKMWYVWINPGLVADITALYSTNIIYKTKAYVCGHVLGLHCGWKAVRRYKLRSGGPKGVVNRETIHPTRSQATYDTSLDLLQLDNLVQDGKLISRGAKTILPI